MRFRRHQQTTRQSQQRSGARHQLRLRSSLWFYDNNSTTSTTVTTPHPIKAKFSSSKSRLLFIFVAPVTQGLRHEKSSCISLTSNICESPSSCWSSLNPYNSDTVAEAQLTERQGTETLGVRLTKRLSK
jgi:hypothetical protein